MNELEQFAINDGFTEKNIENKEVINEGFTKSPFLNEKEISERKKKANITTLLEDIKFSKMQSNIRRKIK